MQNRSIPSSTSTGQTASRNTAAKTSVPSDALGATFLAAKATAKWPMNTSPSEQGFLQAAGYRVVAEPNPEQRTVEILACDGLSPGLAVQHHARPGAGDPVERDDITLLRRVQRVHGCGQLGETVLQSFLLDGRGVVADTFVERVRELLCAQLAHHSHAHPLRSGQRKHVGHARLLLGKIQTCDVDLEKSLGAQPGTVQHQFARSQAGPFVDLDARDFGSKRK